MEFIEFLEKTLREEGGWSDNENDAGGKTMLGITQGTLSVWLGRPASDAEIRNLSRDQAIAIYRGMFYEQPKIHLLPEALQPPVFDWGVNAGPGRAIRGLQTLINKVGVVGHISIDGGIGPFTIKATEETLAALGETTMVNAYQDERQAFYNSIVANNPSQRIFINGWTNRTNRFRI